MLRSLLLAQCSLYLTQHVSLTHVRCWCTNDDFLRLWLTAGANRAAAASSCSLVMVYTSSSPVSMSWSAQSFRRCRSGLLSAALPAQASSSLATGYTFMGFILPCLALRLLQI